MGRSWSARWDRLKSSVSLKDLMLDILGKVLTAIGLGALLAPYLAGCAWILIGIGVALSLSVKAKYWNQFWKP